MKQYFKRIDLDKAGAEDRLLKLFEQIFLELEKLRKQIEEVNSNTNNLTIDDLDVDYNDIARKVANRIQHKYLLGLLNDEHPQYLKERGEGGLGSEVPLHASEHYGNDLILLEETLKVRNNLLITNYGEYLISLDFNGIIK